MSDQLYVLVSTLGVCLALLIQLSSDLNALRKEIRNAARGVIGVRSPRFHFSRSNEIWRSMSLLVRGRRRLESEGREVLSDVLSFGSRIANVTYERRQLIDEIVRVLLERAGSDIVSLAVVLRESVDGPLQIERVEGLPRARIEVPLLMSFDGLLDGAGVEWGYQTSGEGRAFEFSAFGIDLTLTVPLRDSQGICGGVWLGFRKGSQALSVQRRAFVEGIAHHAAASFHASQQMEERARATSSERDLLLGLSHDLRAPGNSALFALSDVLSGDCGELRPEQAERLNTIESALRDQMDLLGDVLDFAKVQRGYLDVTPGVVGLRASAERVVGSLAPAARQAEVAIAVNIEAERCVRADVKHVQRILWNLLSNAIKYAPRSDVHVRVLEQGEFLELLVEDAGAGIPVSEQSRLFTQFSRLSNFEASQGVGLGLSLVKALAEQNGGRAFYRPGKSSGSVFGVALPVARAAEPGVADGSVDAVGLHLKTIVVVDDDPASCRALIRILRGVAKQIVPAESVEEAVELCLALRPDALVSDYYLGDGTAEDLFERLKQAAAAQRGVVLTGSSDPGIPSMLSTRFGVLAIEKPASLDAINQALRICLAEDPVSPISTMPILA